MLYNKFSRNKAILLVVMIGAIYLTIYIFLLPPVMNFATRGLWPSSPAGSLFPWPKRSGHYTALSKMHPLDLIIYIVFLENNLIYFITFCVWSLTIFFYFLSFRKYIKDRSGRHLNRSREDVSV